MGVALAGTLLAGGAALKTAEMMKRQLVQLVFFPDEGMNMEYVSGVLGTYLDKLGMFTRASYAGEWKDATPFVEFVSKVPSGTRVIFVTNEGAIKQKHIIDLMDACVSVLYDRRQWWEKVMMLKPEVELLIVSESIAEKPEEVSSFLSRFKKIVAMTLVLAADDNRVPTVHTLPWV
jgi:hypothetical protein